MKEQHTDNIQNIYKLYYRLNKVTPFVFSVDDAIVLTSNVYLFYYLCNCERARISKECIKYGHTAYRPLVTCKYVYTGYNELPKKTPPRIREFQNAMMIIEPPAPSKYLDMHNEKTKTLIFAKNPSRLKDFLEPLNKKHIAYADFERCDYINVSIVINNHLDKIGKLSTTNPYENPVKHITQRIDAMVYDNNYDKTTN